MNKKQLITSAVTTALIAPMAAFAAIDDQGMAYVSAGEGLSGSLRHDILFDTNEVGEDVSSKVNSLRLWVAGDLDLGGGLKSTYYYEFRDQDGRGTGSLQTEAYDIGIKGPFGSFSVGDLGMVAPRMVPSADLAFERGTNREGFAADPGPNGLRYESPVINGFQFGVSGVLNGTQVAADSVATTVFYGVDTAITPFVTPGADALSTVTPRNKDSLDEFSLAVRYTLPIGLQLGAGYENKENNVPVNATLYNNVPAAAADVAVGVGTAMNTITAGQVVRTRNSDSLNGFRFGARYAQDNWLLGYEYRTYDAFLPNSVIDYLGEGQEFTIDINPASGEGDQVEVTRYLNSQIVSGDKDLSYDVHAIGAMATVDRVVMTAGYSIESNEYTGTAADRVVLERDTIALDAAYKLGSRSTMVVGWKKEDYSADITMYGFNTRGSKAVSTTFLFYRIDF